MFYKLTPLQDPPLFAIVVHDILFFLPVVYMVGYLLWIFFHSSIVLSLLRKYRHGFEHPDELNDNAILMEMSRFWNVQAIPTPIKAHL